MAYVIPTPSRGPVNQAVTLQARLVHKDGSGTAVTDEGNALQQADITSISCSVYDLDSGTSDAAIATPAVVVATEISDTLVDDAIWQVDTIGRNFLHAIPGATFPDPHLYRIVYIATLTASFDSELLHWVYQHQAVSVTTAAPTRASQDDVREIVEVEAGADTNLTAFIIVANALTDKIVDCAAERGQTLSDTQLLYIETYLAAYFYVGKDPRYVSKKTERAEAKFTVPDYWEMARRLDTSGCLDSFGREQYFAEFSWLGKSPSDQIDYVDRD